MGNKPYDDSWQTQGFKAAPRTLEQAMVHADEAREFKWEDLRDTSKDLVLLANEVLRLRTAHLHSEDQLRAKCDEIVALLDEVQRLRAEPPKCSGCGSTEVAPLCDYCHLGY